MLKAGADVDLAKEPFGAQRVRELGMEDFQRDRAIVLEVMGQEHRGHAAASQLTFDAIAIGERGAKTTQHSANVTLALRV